MSTRASTTATTLRGRWLLLARAAWVVIATLTLGLFVASIPGYVFYVLELGQADWMGTPVDAPAALVFALNLLGVLASITAVLVCLTLAVVLFRHRSDDWMVMFISAYLLVYGTVLAGPLERAEAFYPGWPSLAVAVVQPLFFTTPTIALFVLFPDGEFVPRWTRWLILVSIPLSVAMIYQPPAYSWALVGIIVIGTVYAQIYRYRYVSTPTGRQQTKWVLFGILLWLLLMGILSVPYSIELSLPSGSPLPWWTLVGSTSWWLALTIVPLSLSIAILRNRLYDIDIVINRTLVYGSLTVMLGLVYLGSVASLQYASRVLTGHEEQPQLTIVVSTLMIAALFNPLRRRIQSFIDRQFYRRKYDARKTLETFSARLRDETNLEALNNELVGVVRETMQPEHISLWLRPDTASRDGQAD
ncbi:hypothetical protein BH20ACT12_BH20ACT12_11140 [soil metagenome]